MKNTSRKTARATRPTLVVDSPVVTAAPGPADSPDEVEFTFRVEADADLGRADETLYARWSVWRARSRPVTDTDDGSGISIDLELSTDKKDETYHLFGRMDSLRRELSVPEFRKFVAALNAVAAQLPVAEPTTVRVAR